MQQAAAERRERTRGMRERKHIAGRKGKASQEKREGERCKLTWTLPATLPLLFSSSSAPLSPFYCVPSCLPLQIKVLRYRIFVFKTIFNLYLILKVLTPSLPLFHIHTQTLVITFTLKLPSFTLTFRRCLWERGG